MPQSWLGPGGFVAAHLDFLYWLAQVTVLGLLAAVAAALAQRRSAALAHRVWIAALAGVVALPILGVLFAGLAWRIEVTQPSESVEPPLAATAPADAAPVRVDAGPVAVNHRTQKVEIVPAADRSGAATESAPVLPTNTGEVEPAQLPVPESNFARRVGWFGLVCIAGALLSVLLLARLGSAVLMLALRVRRSPLAAESLQSIVASVAAALGVRRRCEVRLLPAGAMPMAFWPGRWVVLLPADFGDWPEDLRQTVVAHELGHVARRDAWCDLFARVVCDALWAHPVLWLARRAVPRLREWACDEWVLASGRVAPQDYARHLLAVVRRCTRPATPLAPAMARASDLEGRLRSILAARLLPARRAAVPRGVAVAGSLLVTAVLASARPVPQEAAPAAGPSAVQGGVEPVAIVAPAIGVEGTVVTADGKPRAGATVWLRMKIGGRAYSWGVAHNRDVLARTATNAEGRFSFTNIGIPVRFADLTETLRRGEGGAEVLALADGFGLAWAEVRGLTGNSPPRLALRPEAPVTGVVHDAAGRDVAGVRVTVFGLTPAVDSFGDWRLAERDELNLSLSEVRLAATTDARGRFVLHGLPPDYRVAVVAAVPGSTHRKVMFVDTGNKDEVVKLSERGGQNETHRVYRSPLAVELEADRLVTVRVTDAEGKPVSDGLVHDFTDGDSRRFDGVAVNERGEARLPLGLSGRYRLYHISDPLRPRPTGEATVTVARNFDPGIIDIRLPPARPLAGRAVDADTGNGIAGVRVYFTTHAASDWRSWQLNASAETDRDGAFRLPVATTAAAGKVIVSTAVPGYLKPHFAGTPGEQSYAPERLIDVPATGPLQPVTVPLARGLALRGVVRDAAGKPVPHASMRADSEGVVNQVVSTTSDAKGRFVLSGLSPRLAARVVAVGAGGIARLQVPAAPDHPLDRARWQDATLTLKPGGFVVRGRALYQGKPRPGVALTLIVTTAGANRHLPNVTVRTDADGRFQLTGLEAGDLYRFKVSDPDDLMDPVWTAQEPYSRAVLAGRTEDVLPDLNLVTHRQTVRGVVVDRQGKPLADMVVTPSAAGCPYDMTGWRNPSWVKTDANGRFVLTQLPDVPLSLMIYRQTNSPGIIRNPCRVRPPLNQPDVRVVFDPELNENIEDLDAGQKAPVGKK